MSHISVYVVIKAYLDMSISLIIFIKNLTVSSSNSTKSLQAEN